MEPAVNMYDSPDNSGPGVENLLGVLFGSASNILSGIFACMGIAEEVIKEMKIKNPGQETLIHGTFAYLAPELKMLRNNEVLYRKHCEEIINRVLRGQDVRPATDSELLCIFSEASLVAVPNSDHRRACYLLFRSVFGKEEARKIWPEEPQEYIPKESESIIFNARRKAVFQRGIEAKSPAPRRKRKPKME